MKTIKYSFICLFVSMILTSTAEGQNADRGKKFSVGMRYGETSGVDFRYNSASNSGIELIAGIWNDWLSFTGLYERNTGAFQLEGMKWYYGAGGHIGVKTGTYYYEGKYYNRGDDYSIGIDGIIGLEYKIPEIPFIISFDLKPLIEISGNGNMYFSPDPGIGLRFTF
jgi:hypothetical protein